MVEEYEEIADSQYQSERQELFDEDYGKQIFCAILAIQAALVLLVVAQHFLHMKKDLTVKFTCWQCFSISGLFQQSFEVLDNVFKCSYVEGCFKMIVIFSRADSRKGLLK